MRSGYQVNWWSVASNLLLLATIVVAAAGMTVLNNSPLRYPIMVVVMIAASASGYMDRIAVEVRDGE